jgi:hypothetical protein
MDGINYLKKVINLAVYFIIKRRRDGGVTL